MPVRIISLTPIDAQVDRVHAFDAPPPYRRPSFDFMNEEEVKAMNGDATMPTRRPCGKHRTASSNGPISDLLERLGIKKASKPSHWEMIASAVHEKHHHPHHDHDRADKEAHEHHGKWAMGEAWKAHVEEMVKSAEGKVLPFLEGGDVRILPVMPDEQLRDGEGQLPGGYPGQGLEGKGGWHRKHGHHGFGRHGGRFHSFSGRLHRALLHLSAPEAIAMAFVLGAGLGSILHFFFMVFLLFVRRMRVGRAGRREARAQRKAERRAARATRKAERKAAKAAKYNTASVSEETLPAYEDEETDRLVEKA